MRLVALFGLDNRRDHPDALAREEMVDPADRDRAAVVELRSEAFNGCWAEAPCLAGAADEEARLAAGVENGTRIEGRGAGVDRRLLLGDLVGRPEPFALGCQAMVPHSPCDNALDHRWIFAHGRMGAIDA